MTPILDEKKMINHPGNKPYWIKENWNKGPLLMQRINNSYQIQCDIKKHKQQWHEAVIEIATEKFGKKKIRDIVIDPAY